MKSQPGATTNRANWRHLQFGIDDNRAPDWIDCGRPGEALLAFALAVHEGALYAGTCEPEKGGSGKVYRFAGPGRWIDCGAPNGSNSVTALAVHEGGLYAGTGKYRVAGSALAESENLTPGGRVFRYEGGDCWADCGRLGENTQTYSFARHEGSLLVGTGPSGRVYRFDDPDRWTDLGRLGEEREVMGMLVHNGRLMAGSLPPAQVYSYEGGDRWQLMTRLDHTPDVTYRRAWTMAEHDGQVFCSTLPSGKIFAFSAGQ